MVLFLAFIIGVWCSLHYLIKKLITVCIQIGMAFIPGFLSMDRRYLTFFVICSHFQQNKEIYNQMSNSDGKAA
jgi:hypothetical protein